MESKYRIFKNGFNKIFDLVETVDKSVLTKFQSIVDSIPKNILSAVAECETDFETGNSGYEANFMRFPNAVSLDYILKQDYLRSEINLHRIFEENLFEQDLSIKIFSVYQRNTQNKKPDLEMYYTQQENGEYIFEGSNDDSNGKAIDITMEVYLENRDKEFFLVSKKYFRGAEIFSKEVTVSFDELMQCVETEEEYGDDWEIEFNADFDI